MKTCPVCTAPIERGGRKGGPLPTYCSADCKKQARNEREQRNGVAERNRVRERARKEKERAARPTRLCPICDRPLGKGKRMTCGAPECKQQVITDRMREYMRTRRADPITGPLHRESSRKANAKRREAVGHWRTVYPHHSVRIDAMRRSRLSTVLVESFAPREVYERDGWVCQLCQHPIDRATPWPESASPSIDHIVPLAKGGPHTLANVQAAHLGCNSRKRDRLDVGPVILDLG